VGKPGARTLHPAYYEEEVPPTKDCGTKWRRGYDLKRSWDRAKPEKSKPDFIMNKHLVHSERKLQRPELPTPWERKAAANARTLLLRRLKWHRRADTIADSNSNSSDS